MIRTEKPLTQWDLDRVVEISTTEDFTEVHFYNKNSVEAMVVYPNEEKTKANIPNILLQEKERIIVWLVYADENGERSIEVETLHVSPRKKPADYVYTETQVITFKKLVKDVEESVNYANAVAKDLEEKRDNGFFNGKDGADGKTAYQYAKEAGYTGTEEEFALELKKDSPTMEQFNKIVSDIEDLKYIPIDITKLTNNVSTAEMGTVINDVTISWTLNKEPVSQTLDSKAVDVSARSKTLNGLALSANKTFTLAVKDERDTTDSAKTTISFLNGVYYGVLESSAEIDSAAILTLTRKLQSSKGITFTADAGATQHIVYAIPARYGTPDFNVGGFDGGFTLAKIIDFTNASGYTEIYDVWLSDNVGLGDTTVNVS